MAKSSAISIDKLLETVDITMEDYVNGVNDVLSEVSQQVANSTEKELQNTSPSRTGAYRKSWTYDNRDVWKGKKNGYRSEMVVFNKDNYRLTHLLEKSHRIANAYGTYGKSKAQPHIAPARKNAEEEFVKLLEKGLEGIRI